MTRIRFLILLAALTPFLATAQFSAQITSIGPTNAVFTVRNATGACTLTLRENNTTGAVHPDWPGILDTDREDEVIADGGAFRQIVIGHNRNDRTLAAAQTYRLSYSGCGGSGAVKFTTKAATVGMSMPILPPTEAGTYHNAAYPAIDWSPTGRSKWYVDPTTGAKLKMVIGPEDFTWGDKEDRAFQHVAGGTGWTAAATILTGGDSTATTGNTNPIYLYPTSGQQWTFTSPSPENIGVIPWLQCVSGSGIDCDVEVMVFNHPGTLPAAGNTAITIRATGTFTQYNGAEKSVHPYANNAIPSGYPRPLYSGWGSFITPQDIQIPETAATASTIANGLITLTAPTSASHIQRGLTAGHHVWVNGATACTANGITGICTVQANTSTGSLQLVEAISLAAGTQFRGLPWGVAIRKVTATGSVRIGAMHRLSGGTSSAVGTLASRCSPVRITRADGVTGFACIVPQRETSYGFFYFIPEDDAHDPVPLDAMYDPVLGGPLAAGTPSTLDPRDVYYPHSSGIRKGRYLGTWGTTGDPTIWQKDPVAGNLAAGARYSRDRNGVYSYTVYSGSSYMTWSAGLTGATAKVAAFAPDEVAAPYTAWPASANFSGMSGPLLVTYRNVNGGQDDGPCQVAVWNMETGNLVDFVNTSTIPGTPLHFGECHSVQVKPAMPLAWYFSANYSASVSVPSTSLLLHGPFRIAIEAIWRSGAWSNNTALGAFTTDTTYDRTCPAVGGGAGQIPQAYADLGANNSNSPAGQCFTMRISGATAAEAVCNSIPKGAPGTPGTGDYKLYGTCAWNASWAGAPALEPGMKFVSGLMDPGANGHGTGTAQGNTENFRVLTVTPEAGDLRVVVQRNACRQLCCVPGTSHPTAPPDYANIAGIACLQDPIPQASHPDDWWGKMMPGTFGSANQFTFYVKYASATSNVGRTIIELPIFNTYGHPGDGRTAGGRYTVVSGVAQRDFADVEESAAQPPPPLYPRLNKFQGVSADIGGELQQYVTHAGISAPYSLQYFSTDVNVYAGQGIPNNFSNYRPATTRAGGTFTRINGDLWQIGTTAPVNIKVRTLLGMVGPKMLNDISSATLGNTITTASPDYSFCYAYKAGECRTGSAAGAAYVKAPWIHKHANATTAAGVQLAMEFANTPGIFSLSPGAGFVRQFISDGADPEGSGQSLVTSVLRPPTQHDGPYWGSNHTPGGRHMLATASGMTSGVRHNVWLISVPPIPNRKQPRAGGLSRMTVSVGDRAGMTHARIRFGTSPAFFCTTRQEQCLTDSVITPYAFITSDSLTATACSTGCTIRVPAMPGRVLFYREETFISGAWVFGKTKVTIPSI